ncbi:MAG TPA: Crp/Fnr family transcriptional regulator [Chloroflexia bacterium]|nr:Crp/Fnr family transcriptional regulator [Chloroflexia bacterium]
MEPSPLAGTPRNRLLALLPASSADALLPLLQPLDLPLKYRLYTPDTPIEAVYFPRAGVCSLLTVLADGTAVEVGTVGNEGFVGIPVVLGATQTPGLAFCQVPGAAWCIPVRAFRAVLAVDAPLRNLLGRYTQALFVQIAQSTACNRAHAVEARAARWLLQTADRVGAPTFALTQQFLAQMLGVRRATVNAVEQRLAEAGLIRYSRGHVTLLDYAGLCALSCECYGIIKAEYDRLLGPA